MPKNSLRPVFFNTYRLAHVGNSRAKYVSIIEFFIECNGGLFSNRAWCGYPQRATGKSAGSTGSGDLRVIFFASKPFTGPFFSSSHTIAPVGQRWIGV